MVSQGAPNAPAADVQVTQHPPIVPTGQTAEEIAEVAPRPGVSLPARGANLAAASAGGGPAGAAAAAGSERVPTSRGHAWRDPWWKPAVGIPLYLLAGALVIGGLAAGITSAAFQGLEVALLGTLAADAWGIRQKTPLLRSSSKRTAALGWALTLLVAIALALLIPAA